MQDMAKGGVRCTARGPRSPRGSKGVGQTAKAPIMFGRKDPRLLTRSAPEKLKLFPPPACMGRGIISLGSDLLVQLWPAECVVAGRGTCRYVESIYAASEEAFRV